MSATRHTPRNKIERLLRLVDRCVELEELSRAKRLLDPLHVNEHDTHLRLQAAKLRIEYFLASRQFSECQHQISATRLLVTDDNARRSLDMYEAHLAALAGDARSAIRLVIPILRTSSPMESIRARGLWVIGLACYRRGHYRWATACFNLAAAFYRLSGRVKELAHVLINLALVAKSQGQIGRALAYLSDAATLIPEHHYNTTRFRLLINRGICLLKLGDLEGSRNCLTTARSQESGEQEPVFLAMIYNNLGHIYRLEQNYTVALEFYEAALSLAIRESSPRQRCLALEFMGETCIEHGQPEKALAYLDEAHELASALAPHGDLMMEVARRRGEAQAALGFTSKACRDLNRAIAICRSRGEKRELALARRALAFADVEAGADFSILMSEVLSVLDDVGDRFEYARTVCLALEKSQTKSEAPPAWMTEPMATAHHYFASLNLHAWLRRIQAAAGQVATRSPAVRSGGETVLVQESPSFARAVEAAQLAATCDDPVLIQGETGSGKEVIARLTHSLSKRRDGAFVAINCGAIPDNLVESELFGHAQGAFTGAGKDKLGLIESARGGTILLDEVVDLPIQAQVKLLRFLDSGEFRRVGETAARVADVRVLAATNQDLLGLVRDGRFRMDLYYRLDVFKIQVPPLRRRQQDIMPLAQQFFDEAAHGGAAPKIAPKLEEWLLSYEWPGNVRQLRNLCRFIFVKAWGKAYVDLEHLPAELRSLRGSLAATATSAFERERCELERDQLIRALRETRGNISKAAQLLRVGRNGLSRRVRDLGIDNGSFK